MAIHEGQKFGRLTVVDAGPYYRRVGYVKHGVCVCECGKHRELSLSKLTASDGTRSCGCIQRESTAAVGRQTKTHGGSRSPEYKAWLAMRYRCLSETSPCYMDYGGRGITVCDSWTRSFPEFFRDVGPRPSRAHSLDRINNNGNYEPGNCRWATFVEQHGNTRYVRTLTYGNKSMSIAGWSRETGISHGTLRHRIDDLQWTVGRALTAPPRQMRSSISGA